MKIKNSLRKAKVLLLNIFFLGFIAIVSWGTYKIISQFLVFLSKLDKTIAAAIVAGSATIITSTLAIVIGRYFESKRDREASHREHKTEVYDQLLKRLFEIFSGPNTVKIDSEEFAVFLKEVHRKLVLWSGPKVLRSYSIWTMSLKRQGDNPKAKTMIQMIDFFLSLRKDLGHSNNGIKHEYLLGMMLKNPELFFSMYKKNANVSFKEIGKAEESLLAK
jgi:hypothetical protein